MLLAAEHVYDPDGHDGGYALVVNRMSPSAWIRGHREAIFYTLRCLEHLDDLGAPVLNGAAAFRYELSKAAQYSLMSRPEQAFEAARTLRYPVLVKPNIGGSGARIQIIRCAGGARREERADGVQQLAIEDLGCA